MSISPQSTRTCPCRTGPTAAIPLAAAVTADQVNSVSGPVETVSSEQVRRLIISPALYTGAGAGASEVEPMVLPNRQAARSLGLPYRSLEGMAQNVVEKSGLRVAPKLLCDRLLRQAVWRAGNRDDAAGLARAAEKSLRELMRAGVDFPRLLSSPNRRSVRLAAIATGYRELLAEQGLIDVAELLWRAAELSPNRMRLQLCGFPRLPAAERAFLDAIAGPGSAVHLPIAGLALALEPSDRPSEGSTQDDGSVPLLFAENGEAVEDFEARGWIVEHSAGRQMRSGPALARTFLRSSLGTAEQRNGPSDGSQKAEAAKLPVVAYGYPDMDAEARGTLGEVKRLLRAGIAPDEVAIVARDEESYGPVLLSVAHEYGVPLRVLYQVPLAQTRFGAWLGELMEALAQDLPFEVTVRLLAHPLVNALDSEMWEQARLHHTRGFEAWTGLLPPLGGSWPAQAPREQYSRRLESLLQRLGVPRNAHRWAREARALQSFADELRALPAAEHDVTLDNFAAEVTDLVRVLTVPAQPGRGGVEVHTPLSLFGASVRHLFVVGAAEGLLPSPVRPDPLLDPFERERLREAGYSVEGVAAAALREELSFWALLHTPLSSLTISYPRLLGRSETLPSPYLARLGVEPKEPPARLLCSIQELRRARLRSEEPIDAVMERARHAHAVESDRESEAEFDAYDGLLGIPYLPPSSGLGVTRLIALASCPFRFFGESVLRVAEPEEAAESLEPSLRGQLFHDVLQRVMERARDHEDPRQAALEALDQAFEAVEQELLLTALSSWRLERGQHLATLRRALAAEEFIHPEAQVRELESSFQATWRGIPVRGRVDRIDSLPDGLELLDYKSGTRISNLAKDAAGRSKVDLQLSIYREAAAEALAPGQPVSGTRYFSIKRAENLRVSAPSEDELERIAEQARLAWRQGSYPVDPDIDGNACEHCALDALCRKGPRLERKRNRL